MKSFEDILEESVKLLQRQGKISYRALKRQFEIDDEYLQDLIYELTEIKLIAREERGIMLVLLKAEGVSGEEPMPEIEQEQKAEKRQLTVMFVDLVGSTRLSNQIDAEDFANILYKYQGLFDKVAKKYGGTIVQLLGDGIMTYYGHPVAHEDDPIRAIFSGIEMLDSLQTLNLKIHKEYKTKIEIRIGVHTGFVVIGGPLVKGHTKMLALGEAPNLAARIQNFAEPDTMLISPITNRLVTGMFKTESTGQHSLKGIDEPMELFKVLGEKIDVNSELGSENPSIGFVGRKHEKSIINKQWHKARSGQGQAILVNGIAGIGKSRLIQSSLYEIAQNNVSVLRLYCSPYNQNTSYYSVIKMIKKQIDISGDITQEKLKAFLTQQDLKESNDLPLLVNLLGLKDLDVSPITASSDVLRNMTNAFLLRMFLSKSHKYILLIEDMHWSDPSTLDLFDQIVTSIDHYPVLCVITCRPEFDHTWKGQSHIHELLLSRLRKEEAQSMIHQLANKMPDRMLAELLEKTDGNPLFVEELTKLVMETGMLDNNQEENSYNPLSNLSIPSTLQDSLMARLDRIGDQAKRIAQMGAAVGREFSYGIIEAISGLPENVLEEHLSTLINAQMLSMTTISGDRIYTFKHALTQDAAYGSLLKSDRNEFHQKIVKFLETKPKHLSLSPELFADHYTKAGLLKESIPYWKQAGEIAVARSAHKEAINHLGKGLLILDKLPDSPQKVTDELFFQLSIGVPYTVLLGYGSPEVEKAYNRAKELSESLESSNQLITALYGLWRHYLLRGKYKEAKELSDRLLELSAESEDIMYANVANRAAGSTAFYTGHLEDAKLYLEKIVAKNVSFEKHSESLLYDVIDMWVAGYSYLSWTYWLLGEKENAIKSSDAAIDLANKLNHPFSVAFSLCFASWLYQFAGDYDKTVELGQRGYLVAEEHGFKFWNGWAHLMMHWVGDKTGNEGQLELIEQDLEDWFSTGSRLGTSYFLYLRAERYLDHNLFDRTKAYLDEANEFIVQTGEQFWAPEICRLKGEYHQNLEEENLAIDQFKQAHQMAKEMNSKSLELRALNSLLSCELDHESLKSYLEELKNLLPSFQSQKENPDLILAKDLMQSLESPSP